MEKAAGVLRGGVLPEKTDEWLSSKDMVNLPGGRRPNVKDAVDAILTAYDEGKLGEQTVHFNGQSIRTQKMQSGSQQSVCIYRKDWPKVEKAAGVLRRGIAEEDGEVDFRERYTEHAWWPA